MKQYKSIHFLFFILIISGLTSNYSFALTMEKPRAKDTCPVCGMFVSLYPDWTAFVAADEGSKYFFDGAKDMFKFILNQKKWVPEKREKNLVTIQVTDYYTLQPLDGKEAFYVIGSDVLGPMGHELIPHETKEAAHEFIADHNGVRIIIFEQVTNTMLEKLDAGIFE